MTARVPFTPPIPRTSDVRCGISVRGPTFADLVDATNWLRGQGGMTFPMCNTHINAGLGGSASDVWQWHYRIFPAYESYDNVLLFYGESAEGETITVADNLGGSSQDHAIPEETGTTGSSQYEIPPTQLFPVQYAVAFSVRSTGYVSVTTGSDDLNIVTMGLCAVPRLTLDMDGVTASGSDDIGVDIQRTRVGQPMWTGLTADGDWGMRRLAEGLQDHGTVARRIGHFAFMRPSFLNSASTTTHALEFSTYIADPSSSSALTGWTNLFEHSIPVVTRPGTLVSGSAPSTNEATLSVFAKKNASAGTGWVRAVVDSGDVVTLTVTSTSWAWYSATIDVTPEDPTQTMGLPSNSFATEEVTIGAGQSTEIGGRVYVASVFIDEEP